MNDEQKKKIEKFQQFQKKAAVHANLPVSDELSTINETLQEIAKKGNPEVQKVSIEGVEIITIKGKDGVDGKDSSVPGPQGEKGENGIDGKDGQDGVAGKDGKDGVDGEDGVDGIDGKDGVDGHIKDLSPQEIRDSLELLTEDERLDASAIKGFEETLKSIKESGKSVRIGGGSRGVQLYVNGVKKGLAQFIDIEAGPNITISDSIVNGLHTLTITSTGGSGFTTLAATETPDSSLTAFTFSTATAKPSYLVVDNVWMKPVTATGTVNWTWNAGTKVATLIIAPVDDIWGVV